MMKSKRAWRFDGCGAVFGLVYLGLAGSAMATEPLWVRQLGTDFFDDPYGVATGGGNVYLTGVTWGSLGGANQGSGDAWVAKYSTR